MFGEFYYLEQEGLSKEEKGIKYIFRQVALGLNYLHSQMRIAHRDIKPENIFMKSDLGRIKIGDYTVALKIPNDKYILNNKEGTLHYEAPEMFT